MGIRVSSDKKLWRGGRLPYLIDTAALGEAGTRNVSDAILDWNATSLFLQLTPRDGEKHYAEFVPSPDAEACSSPTGVQRKGRQEIRCAGEVKSILHEIGHAARLWHEHCREDRDSYVTILKDNISPKRLHNFEKHSSDGIDLGDYDYASLMHYAATNVFAKEAGLIMIVAPVGTSIGVGSLLSQGDEDALQLMYQGRVGWTVMRGKLMHVSNRGGKLQWGVDSDNNIYRRNVNAWTKIAGELNQISVAADGTVWGVNSSNKVYRRDGTSWIHISGRLKHISVGSNTNIWGVNADDEIYCRTDNGWIRINGKLKQISAASDGTIWGVNASNKIYRRDGNSWTRIGGSLEYVSVGSSTEIWGVNSSGEIYFRDVPNDEWEIVSGKLSQISVAADGTVWGVDSSGNTYRR